MGKKENQFILLILLNIIIFYKITAFYYQQIT